MWSNVTFLWTNKMMRMMMTMMTNGESDIRGRWLTVGENAEGGDVSVGTTSNPVVQGRRHCGAHRQMRSVALHQRRLYCSLAIMQLYSTCICRQAVLVDHRILRTCTPHHTPASCSHVQHLSSSFFWIAVFLRILIESFWHRANVVSCRLYTTARCARHWVGMSTRNVAESSGGSRIS